MSPYLAAGLDGTCRADDHKAASGILGTQNHALALDALEFAGREVGDEAHLLAHQVLGLIPLGNTADDGASCHAVINGEFQQLVGLFHFFALHDGAHTDVEFGKVVDGARCSDGFGFEIIDDVFLFDALQTLDLGIDDIVLDFLEQQHGLFQLAAGSSRRRPYQSCHAVLQS